MFAGQAAASLPLAFLAKADEDKEVAQQWGEVWEEGTVSAAGALRLYMGEIVPLVLAGEWGNHCLCEVGARALPTLLGISECKRDHAPSAGSWKEPQLAVCS